MLLLVPIALIDLDHQIIPNKLTLAGTVLAPVILLLTDPGALPEHLIAGAAAGLFLLVAVLAYPGGMGMGDVKLAWMMGLFLGRDVGVALLVGLLAGSIVGGIVMARKGVKAGRKTQAPVRPVPGLRRPRRPARGRAHRRLVPDHLRVIPPWHGALAPCRAPRSRRPTGCR